MESFRPLPGLNFAWLEAAMLIGAPVAGLRPVLALRLRDREGAEADETNLVLLLERCGDCVEHGVHCLARLGLGQARRVGNNTDQIVLVHWGSSR